MKTWFLDTKSLISYVTDRNPAQQEVVAPLFESAAGLQCRLLIHQSALTEFVFVMDRIYHTPKETVAAMVRELLVLPGVTAVSETDFGSTFSLWPGVFSDFGDALLAAAAKKQKGCTAVTFDRKFRAGLQTLGVDVL